jgi:uncharacterized protein (TIGR02588 family)
MAHQAPRPNERQEAAPSAWEWLVAGIGLALLVGSLGYLVHDALVDEGRSPAPAVRVTGIEAQGGRYLVRLQVGNESRATAADLRVEGELRRGAEVVERSETEFAYLPGRSVREGGLYFRQDPRSFELVLSARSYQKP